MSEGNCGIEYQRLISQLQFPWEEADLVKAIFNGPEWRNSSSLYAALD